MDVNSFVASILKKSSLKAFVVWLLLCVFVTLLFRLLDDEPLDGDELIGLVFVLGVIVFAVRTAVSLLRKRAKRASRGTTISIAMLTILGCAFTNAPPVNTLPGDMPRADLLRSSVGGDPPKVSLLARAFLPRTATEDPGFAFYTYLLFTQNDEGTRSSRRTAALAYLDLFSNAGSVKDLNIEKKDMAILYAPLCSDGREVLKKHKDNSVGELETADAFLNDYDYDRARLVVRSFSHNEDTIPRVAIVGSPAPLPQPTIDPATLWIVDLDVPSAAVVRSRIRRLRDDLETGRGQTNPGRLRDLIRSALSALGRTLSDIRGVTD